MNKFEFLFFLKHKKTPNLEDKNNLKKNIKMIFSYVLKNKNQRVYLVLMFKNYC